MSECYEADILSQVKVVVARLPVHRQLQHYLGQYRRSVLTSGKRRALMCDKMQMNPTTIPTILINKFIQKA
eukprot:4445922-Amphidinium_carterae.1